MPSAKFSATKVAKRPQRTGRSVAEARKSGTLTNSKASAALISEEKPLTDMQRLFVKYWAGGESLTNAYVRAGYDPAGASYAYRMAHMPNILALYQEEKRAFERDNQMSRKQVMEGFMDGIEMAKMLGEPASVIAGWREVGRMCGYYEPVKIQHQHTHEGKVLVEKLDRMSNEELAELIAKRAGEMLQGVPNAEDARIGFDEGEAP